MKTLVAVLAGLLLATVIRWGWNQVFSFRAQTPELYAGQTPAFDITEVLSGPMTADGVIYNFAGRVTARLTADLMGEWEGGTGTLTERFVYSTGTTQRREWTLEVAPDGTITGRAPDIIGEARGRQEGATVSLRYKLVLPESAGGYTINVVDWMYLTDSGTVVNRAEFRKFGIKVGELIATFTKVDQ